MTVDINKVIDWYDKGNGKIVYSMGPGSELNQGPRQLLNAGQSGSTDCSGGMTSALKYGGANVSTPWGGTPPYSTVSIGNLLQQEGFKKVYSGKNTGAENMWDMKKGDIVVMGAGSISGSAGGAGHIGILCSDKVFVSVQYNGNSRPTAVTKAASVNYFKQKSDHLTYFEVWRLGNGAGDKNGDKKQNNSKDKDKSKGGDNLGKMWRFNDWVFGASTSGTSGKKAGAKKDDKKNNGSAGTGTVGQLKGKAGGAIKWILDKSHWNSQTDSGAPGIDWDGAFHAQCFDLGLCYMDKMGLDWHQAAGKTNSIPDSGETYFKSKGWTVVHNPSFQQLSIGAITYESFPHTEIITAIEGNKISFCTQNLPSPSIHTVTYSGSGAPKGFSGAPIVTIAYPPKSDMT